MKNKIIFSIAIILVVGLGALIIFGQTQYPPIVWEYKFETGMTEKKANELGSEGWELTAIESPAGIGQGKIVATYVFKRKK